MMELVNGMYRRLNIEYIEHIQLDKLTGVRQGENSPLLFSLLINDYFQLMLMLYADDTVMSNTKEGLQKAIDQMCGFCEKWKLNINSEKTKVTVFGNRKVDTRDLKFDAREKA